MRCTTSIKRRGAPFFNGHSPRLAVATGAPPPPHRLAKLPLFKQLLKFFITKELFHFSDLKAGLLAELVAMGEFSEAETTLMLDTLHDRVSQHNIEVRPFSTRPTASAEAAAPHTPPRCLAGGVALLRADHHGTPRAAPRLADRTDGGAAHRHGLEEAGVHTPPCRTPHAASHGPPPLRYPSASSDLPSLLAVQMYARLDRPAGIITFAPPKKPNELLNDWASDISQMLNLIEGACHLIHKENMIHKIV